MLQTRHAPLCPPWYECLEERLLLPGRSYLPIPPLPSCCSSATTFSSCELLCIDDALEMPFDVLIEARFRLRLRPCPASLHFAFANSTYSPRRAPRQRLLREGGVAERRRQLGSCRCSSHFAFDMSSAF